jgi:hypothetical protein
LADGWFSYGFFFSRIGLRFIFFAQVAVGVAHAMAPIKAPPILHFIY